MELQDVRKLKIEVDTAELDDTLRKLEKLVELSEKANQVNGSQCEQEQMMIDCIAQHIKAFFEQAVKKEKADFGEPCANCSYYNNGCRFEWLDVMDPLLKKSNVSISVRSRDILGREDNDRTHPGFQEDTHLNNNTHI